MLHRRLYNRAADTNGNSNSDMDCYTHFSHPLPMYAHFLQGIQLNVSFI